jgi:Helix-turn-helix family
MDVVAQIAPEVDRLVWAIGPTVLDSDRERLRASTESLGLESLGYVPNFAEFFLGRGITTELIKERQRYVDPLEVDAWIGALDNAGAIESSGGWWSATTAGEPLFCLIKEVQTGAAHRLWGAHGSEIEAVNDAAGLVVESASDDHSVATVYRELALPTEPSMAMLRRLVNLRYLRQHDHAVAWTETGLAAAQMVALTELWHGGVTDDSDALTSLVEAGLATADQTLTPDGQTMRDEIEAETNRRNAEDFAVLGDEGMAQFLDNLKALPPR